MDYQEASASFIEAWGKMGSNWGVSRTMAQIHALLLISPEPLSTEDIMDALKVSRGSTSMNLRALLDWNLIHKELKAGDRREYFAAEKDIWTVFKNVIKQRKKKELEPMIQVLRELSQTEDDDYRTDEFKRVVEEIRLFSEKADKTLSTVTESKASQFFRTFLK
ncbi:MAG: ArsR family transcriptional regulator [Saprospiraceae bacterium]|nr:ArsR family transcriptional regulator [Saprospiraceae bacterium]